MTTLEVIQSWMCDTAAKKGALDGRVVRMVESDTAVEPP